MSAPSKRTVYIVRARDEGRCAKCGNQTHGERGVDWSLHHRRPRGSGGTSLDWVNLPGNLVLLCGSGTTECHGWVESHRIWSMDAGFLVSLNGRARADEVAIVHAVHGLVLLMDDGTTRDRKVT